MFKIVKQVIRRADALPPELLERIFEVRNRAGESEKSCDFREAERLLLLAWEILPEPKYDWELSEITVCDLFDFYLTQQNFTECERWLLELDLASRHSPNPTLFLALGKLRFEQGNFEEARSAFAQLHKAWGHRAFRGEPPKYWDFLKKNQS